MTKEALIIALAVFLAGGAELYAAEIPDDTASEMKVKSRKLVFKADPKGLDWAARGSLTKTKTGRWIATYTQATQHGRIVPRLVVVHTSDDEGRSWSKPNCLPDGKPVKGAPLRAEHERVEPADGGVLTCPNGDLLYISMTKDHDGQQWHQMRTLQWRSTDNGASWKFEGRSSGIPAGESLSLGKTVEGGSIYVTVYGFPASESDQSTKSDQLLREELFQTMLYRSDDNALTWKKVSVYGTLKDRINETGVVCVDKDTIMIVCRTFDEETTKMRISRDRGKTWGPMTDITEYVHAVQQPKLTKFPEEPGRIYLTGRDRILEHKQRNCLWYTDDVGKTWKMKPVDDAYFNDSGYGEILKRKNGDLYYLGYRGTDHAADLWEFVIESDYKDARGTLLPRGNLGVEPR